MGKTGAYFRYMTADLGKVEFEAGRGTAAKWMGGSLGVRPCFHGVLTTFLLPRTAIRAAVKRSKYE